MLTNSNFEIVLGKADQKLKTWPDRCIHSVITSPPYWQQRDYENKDQLGNEPTVEMYLHNLMLVFDEVQRVLRNDGTVWVNLGDRLLHGNLVNVPMLFAERMKQHGWFYRQYFPWLKRNAIPKGGDNRPHDSLECVLMFTKAKDGYFYDQLAAKEQSKLTSRNFRNGDAIILNANTDFWVFDVLTRKNWSKHFSCVDEETECLTAQGWKTVDQIKKGDIAAQYSLESGLLSWGPVEDVAVYPVSNQEMVVSDSTRVPMLLTPNHRCVIVRKNGNEYSEPEIILAEDLKKNHCIPVSASWEKEENKTSIGEAWAELLGWYLAEGHACKDSDSIEIYQSQSANGPKCEQIEHLLYSVEAEWQKASYQRKYRGSDTISSVYRVSGFVAYRLREIAPQKRIPIDSILWPQEEIEALLRGLIGGDGFIRNDGTHLVYVQKSKADCDLAQILALRLGWSASVSARIGGNGMWTTNFVPKRHLNSLLGTAGEGAILRQAYSGRVWCPKMPLGTWVARKNGRVFITGNTFPPLLAEIMVRASTSDGGCCNRCGIQARRLVSKTRYATRSGNKSKNDATGKAFRDKGRHLTDVQHVGWEFDCSCDREAIDQSIILDPFSGMATTGVACLGLKRKYVGIEINPEYKEMSEGRLRKLLPAYDMFSDKQNANVS